MEIVENNEINNKSKICHVIKFSKEDFEKYYIDERKSINEISKIYDCVIDTVRNRLKKYKIPIRPYGAFLVDNDGKTLSSKYKKGEISEIEYQNKRVKNKGYKNHSEYNRKMDYKKGIGTGLSMSENKDCSAYLGVHICENKEFLSKIINIIESMPNNNPGYDVVCVKNKKIDVKCACINSNNQWSFVIKKNKIADYFLMISFDNRENLGIKHIWLAKGNSVIKRTTWNSREFIINEKNTVMVSNGKIGLNRWSEYEIIDTRVLKKVREVCDSFKGD